MFARLSAFSFTLLALPIFASATVLPRGGSSGCTSGTLECCSSVQDPSSNAVQTVLADVGVDVGDITVPVGLTCDPITVIGVGSNQCSSQAACCTGENYNGLAVLGCIPVNVGV
ncbi:hydrophobin [Guyanagaster necrorhizus]|uniref:Hydrophobin n=1 Tax=Guyanagaster necrorhizus TaxID=856835 RepID=A0A9P8AML6_9AGAR|nr:hydrophobin [Guyanagaster necrorhizus MCA 3950]KAG7441378.1 hydrophobin [Guyanagaster necrorhizus MCA 3950]